MSCFFVPRHCDLCKLCGALPFAVAPQHDSLPCVCTTTVCGRGGNKAQRGVGTGPRSHSPKQPVLHGRPPDPWSVFCLLHCVCAPCPESLPFLPCSFFPFFLLLSLPHRPFIHLIKLSVPGLCWALGT